MNTENPDTPAPETTPAEPARESPGALIREARQRMSLSLDDLAVQTKLARHTLEALERDDFAALLEPVYVRGYYRKCAKVLDLPEQRLLDAYGQRVMPKAPQPPAKLRLASGTELGSGSRLPVPLAIGAALIAVVVCGFVWMARQSAPVSAPATTSTVVVPADGSAAPVVGEPQAVDPATVMSEPSPADPLAAPGDAVPATADPAAAATPADAAPAAAAPATPAATGPGAVVLRFSGTSWVRIDDANGRVLLSGEFPAGETRTVQGATPLNVHLGKASAVTVEYLGRTVDFGAQVRSNDTARFTLPLGAP